MALNSIMHQVGEAQASVIRLVRRNLVEAADEAEEMEGLFEVPRLKVESSFGSMPDAGEGEVDAILAPGRSWTVPDGDRQKWAEHK